MLTAAHAGQLPLADGSVQCVVTSPPYWGLRKYAGEQERIWKPQMNADERRWETCAHEWVTSTRPLTNPGRMMPHGDGRPIETDTYAQERVPYPGHQGIVERGTCVKCGAWRGAYGLEPTVEMYVAHTVEILREVRRVLRADGVCFLNLGDSYAGGGNNRGNTSPLSQKQASNAGAVGQCANIGPSKSKRMPRGNGRWGGGDNFAPGLKPKDLCLIPERVALAAQGFAAVSARQIAAMADTLRHARLARDWPAVEFVEVTLRLWATWAFVEDAHWVRSAIIWVKPNPMPESATDRPTDAYEFILMLTKSARYFWDAEAVKEPGATTEEEAESKWRSRRNGTGKGQPEGIYHGYKDSVPFGNFTGTRNLRNVWTFATQPYSGAHFATFPEELPRRCILAATSAKGACAQCGAPWERITEISNLKFQSGSGKAGNVPEGKYAGSEQAESGSYDIRMGPQVETRTIGWIPGCECYGTPLPPSLPEMPKDAKEPEACGSCEGSGTCNVPLLGGDLPCKDCAGSGFEGKGNALWHAWREEWEQVQAQRLAILSSIEGLDLPVVPCVVLDPFGGSGTTGRVAVELGQRAVLCDLGFAHPSHKVWLDWKMHEELSETTDYAELADRRTGHVQRQLAGL